MKKCPFCAEDVADSAIKCRFCGESIGEVNLITEQIKDHLEFVGYDCEKVSSDQKMDVIICKNTSKSNLVVSYNKTVNIVFLKARYNLKKEGEIKLNKEYYEKFNDINTKASVGKRFSEIDDEKNVIINIEGTFIGYDKKTFGVFIDLFEGEISSYLKEFTIYTN